MTDFVTEAQKKLMLASFALGLAQRELEEAERKWKAALDTLSALEQKEAPDFREMRGILKR